jgi:tRNA(Ile)-lysidine synthase
VATAHTRDDQAETVLLRLLRGTGTSGLAGIHRSCDLQSVNDQPSVSDQPGVCDRSIAPRCVPDADPPSPAARLIRPLLATSRQQIERYLLSVNQPFRHDASNLDPRFLRNRVRAELLPWLERDYNPQLRQALCETAEVAAAENGFLEDLVTVILGERAKTQPEEAPTTIAEQGIELPLFQAQPVALQRRILRRLCQPHGLALDFAQLEGLRDFALAGRAGSIGLPRGWAAEVVRHKLLPLRLRLLRPKRR